MTTIPDKKGTADLIGKLFDHHHRTNEVVLKLIHTLNKRIDDLERENGELRAVLHKDKPGALLQLVTKEGKTL